MKMATSGVSQEIILIIVIGYIGRMLTLFVKLTVSNTKMIGVQIPKPITHMATIIQNGLLNRRSLMYPFGFCKLRRRTYDANRMCNEVVTFTL